MHKDSISTFLKDPIENSDDCFNFYDWFCKDSSLVDRMLSMVSKLKFLVQQGILDVGSMYVFFKNNCPMYGTTYDDMRFSSLDEESTFRGGVCPRSGHDNVDNKCEVWYFKKDGDMVQKSFQDWSSFKRELKLNPELKNELAQGFKGEL